MVYSYIVLLAWYHRQHNRGNPYPCSRKPEYRWKEIACQCMPARLSSSACMLTSRMSHSEQVSTFITALTSNNFCALRIKISTPEEYLKILMQLMQLIQLLHIIATTASRVPGPCLSNDGQYWPITTSLKNVYRIRKYSQQSYYKSVCLLIVLKLWHNVFYISALLHYQQISMICVYIKPELFPSKK